MIWTFSHGDTPYKYYYSWVGTPGPSGTGKVKIWKRVKVTAEIAVFNFNPNCRIWFSNEQSILKFLE